MYINNYLIEANDKIVVAVSGGPDSMCLLHYLNDLKPKLNLQIYVAHINHHTRGKENTLEQEMIEKYCLSNDLDFYVENFIYQGDNNFHDEARKFRYDFFVALCQKLNANKLALAHHLDDQVETILFKIARGNNLTGYTGMKEIYSITDSLQIIRPFLKLTKQVILDRCIKYNIPYHVDSSNLSEKYTRNFIRHKIIPQFKIIQPDFSDKLIQLQQQIVEVNDYLEKSAETIFDNAVTVNSNEEIIINLEILKQTHISVIRLILLNVFTKLTNNKVELSFDKANNIINNIINPKPNIIFNIGKGYFCIKEYDKLIFRKGVEDNNFYSIQINQPGEYLLPNSQKLKLKIVEEKAKNHTNSLILCYNSTMWPLIIRNRIEGDYVKTKIGRKKISRIFIDNKIPTSHRNNWPILTDNLGNILWVIGLQKASLEACDSKQYILISIE